MNRIKRQMGLSMIELLVALLIGSFLVIGITQIYIDNRRSYAFQQSQSENQEGSRYAMLVLQQELNKAGYRRRNDIPWDENERFGVDNSVTGCNFAVGQSVLWDNTSGSLCIRYEPRSITDRDCLGNTLDDVPTDPYEEYTGSPAVFIERFYVDDNRLMCATNTNDTAGELMAGVAGLRFEIGLAEETSDGRALKEYVKQRSIGADEDIVAVRYMALLRSSGGKIRDSSDDSPLLSKWQQISGASDAEIEALKLDDVGQIYQISQSTVMFRNLMP